jgi:hypothetical protein
MIRTLYIIFDILSGSALLLCIGICICDHIKEHRK